TRRTVDWGCSLNGRGNLPGGCADENHMLGPGLYQGCESLEVTALILSSKNDDQPPIECLERLDRRINVGRLRIVVERDAICLPREFDPMLDPLEVANRKPHGLGGRIAGESETERSHYILEIVRTFEAD